MDVQIKIHEIAKDGLPPTSEEDPTISGRVAFIFDGCIVSGWPLRPEGEGREVYVRNLWSPTEDGILWEADTDVGHNRPMGNVTHWVEFPFALWNIPTPHRGVRL